MIEVNVPEDIRKFEPTVVGPFTTRQALSLAATAGLVYTVYMIEKAMGIQDPAQVPVFLIFAVPPMLCGWFKPYGMHFEKFIFKAFRENILSPSKRKYVVENMWDTIIEEENKDKEKNKVEGKALTANEIKELPEEMRPYK
ncbi:PrgI family protein [Butyrivibrio fibrisolvens]|uniref:PrgI family protein n=1 Tax=Butyrivibrio fibrisolvens TaxID=831 RepID=UPI0003B6E110|nr:PrgI family protein [Butyrivibrio fibrisolvens]